MTAEPTQSSSVRGFYFVFFNSQRNQVVGNLLPNRAEVRDENSCLPFVNNCDKEAATAWLCAVLALK